MAQAWKAIMRFVYKDFILLIESTVNQRSIVDV